jgi:sarcosine oxidase, subunit alpha
MAPASLRRFRFGRSSVEARSGETVLAALARRGWPSLVRSVRYHRPRGPSCGVGDCTGCLVRINGVPNQRACRRVVHEGDVVRSENSWPSPAWDLLGVTDHLLPHGLDTVHGLRRPALLTGLYQRAVRHLAGFGNPPDFVGVGERSGLSARSAEVVVVGAGRSGRGLAGALVRAGVRPLLLERDPSSGAGLPPGVELLPETTATFLPPPEPPGAGFSLLGFDAERRGLVVRARSVVVATGGYDAALLFEGSDRPGVVTADLALSSARLPLGKSVVVGGGARARAVVDRLGSDAAAVVAFGEIGPDLAQVASGLGVPLYPRSRVVRSLGRGHVRGLEVARRDGGGHFRLRCSSIVLAHRRLPNAQLLFQAGAIRRWSAVPGAYYPETDGAGRTAVPGLFAVGAAARPEDSATPEWEDVARAIVAGGSAAGPSPTPGGPRSELLPYYRELLGERRRGKWVVCPCEDVLLQELEVASARGFRGLEVIKRYTGVGTGLCQGRYCLPEAILVLAILERREPTEVGYITQRPPLVPTPLGALASAAGEFDREAVP